MAAGEPGVLQGVLRVPEHGVLVSAPTGTPPVLQHEHPAVPEEAEAEAVPEGGRERREGVEVVLLLQELEQRQPHAGHAA